jgi:hypothetical protein
MTRRDQILRSWITRPGPHAPWTSHVSHRGHHSRRNSHTTHRRAAIEFNKLHTAGILFPSPVSTVSEHQAELPL